MKSFLIFTLIALMGLAMPATIGANNNSDGWACYSSNNYRGSKKVIRPGEYRNCSSWRYYSWKSKCAVKFYYYQKNGKKGERVLHGDVRDLRAEMRGWQNLKYGANAGWRNIYKAVFYCKDGGSQANNGHNSNNSNQNAGRGQGNYNNYLKQGQCVAWEGTNYGRKFISYRPGKKYYARNLSFQFSSMRLPKDYLVMFTYRSSNGRNKEYQCRTDIRDINAIARSWDIRDKRNPWKHIQYFELRKAKSNSSTGGNDRGFDGKEWYNRYKTGYIVFSEHKYFDGDYEAKANGDYDYRKLGFHPKSIYVPKSNRYLIMEYYAKNGKVKSAVIKKSIDDLDRYLYHLGVNKKYKKTPYKAVKRFAVIRQ